MLPGGAEAHTNIHTQAVTSYTNVLCKYFGSKKENARVLTVAMSHLGFHAECAVNTKQTSHGFVRVSWLENA